MIREILLVNLGLVMKVMTETLNALIKQSKKLKMKKKKMLK